MPKNVRNLNCILVSLLLFTLNVSNACAQVSALTAGEPQKQPDFAQQSVTVSLCVENNRPFVDIEFAKPDGTMRKARFWVDTGGGAFILVEPLARELGLNFGPEMSDGSNIIPGVSAQNG